MGCSQKRACDGDCFPTCSKKAKYSSSTDVEDGSDDENSTSAGLRPSRSLPTSISDLTNVPLCSDPQPERCSPVRNDTFGTGPTGISSHDHDQTVPEGPDETDQQRENQSEDRNQSLNSNGAQSHELTETDQSNPDFNPGSIDQITVPEAQVVDAIQEAADNISEPAFAPPAAANPAAMANVGANPAIPMQYLPIIQPDHGDQPQNHQIAPPAPVPAPQVFQAGPLEIIQSASSQIDLMEDLSLPDDVGGIEYPKIGDVQLLKLVDAVNMVYDGIDIICGTLKTVRRLTLAQHIHRLRLASRLSLFQDEDLEEYKRIYELLFPTGTTFVPHMDTEADGTMKMYYYWMEKPNHGSLHAYYIERKRLPQEQVKDYFQQICQIVQFCHKRNVVIRDLKLRKFVFADGRRKTVALDDVDALTIVPEMQPRDPTFIDISDFNLEDDRVRTRHGCPAYVSPELLDLSKMWYSGKASDIWSLGILLFVLVVGRYPFFDVTPAGLFSKIRAGRFYISSQHDNVTLEVCLLIRFMLKVNPRDRPTIFEVLSYPWLKPKDYRASFKTFDSSQAVFWRSANQRAPNADGPSTSGLGQRIIAPSSVEGARYNRGGPLNGTSRSAQGGCSSSLKIQDRRFDQL